MPSRVYSPTDHRLAGPSGWRREGPMTWRRSDDGLSSPYSFRMYVRSRRGIVLLQAQIRGRTVRKVNAATKIESFYRMHVRNSAYRKLKSATIALQCCARRASAKKIFEKAKPSTSNSSFKNTMQSPRPSKHAKSKLLHSPPSKENMNNGKNYTSPPTKEIYTKDQEKAVEDVLLASKSGTASYYKVLDLQIDASNADITKGYRKLALKIHPDKNGAPLAGDAFTIINNAYEVLNSPSKKAAYDINIAVDTSNSVPRPPPTSEYAPGTSIYNTIPVGTDVTLHNPNSVSSRLNGITGYVVSFQQGQYKIKRADDAGYIGADPLALLQNIDVLSRRIHKEVKVVSYLSKYNLYNVKSRRGLIYSLGLDEFIIPNGTVVRLVVDSPEYNGKFGRIIGWTESTFGSDGADTGRYKVQLSLEKTVLVKMAKVRL